jgi:hypothetical protein
MNFPLGIKRLLVGYIVSIYALSIRVLHNPAKVARNDRGVQVFDRPIRLALARPDLGIREASARFQYIHGLLSSGETAGSTNDDSFPRNQE